VLDNRVPPGTTMLGSEMAIAASLPAPRRLITDQGCNAAVFGRDDDPVTVIVSEALLARLDRAETSTSVCSASSAVSRPPERSQRAAAAALDSAAALDWRGES